MRHHRKNDDTGIGCFVMVLLAILAMPLVGLYMTCKGDENEKVVGIILIIIGVIIWICIGVN